MSRLEVRPASNPLLPLKVSHLLVVLCIAVVVAAYIWVSHLLATVINTFVVAACMNVSHLLVVLCIALVAAYGVHSVR